MTIPSSGPVSMDTFSLEFAKQTGVARSLTEFYGLASGIPTSGTISFSHLLGKSASFTLNINSQVASPNIRTLAIKAGWNQNSKLIVNINTYVNTLRLEAGWSFPNGILINIAAGAGIGGTYNGGTAFYTRVPVEIYNAGSIMGGGGAGGNGLAVYVDHSFGSRLWISGGGGGNGVGYTNTISMALTARTNGATAVKQTFTGEVVGEAPWGIGGKGGKGGDWGVAGSPGVHYGNWGGNTATGGIWVNPGAGGAAGCYIDGSAYASWLATGTRMGRAI